jgi:AraC family transcriptional regulator, transcriptional activator of pobA
MGKKAKVIPLYPLAEKFDGGIDIKKISSNDLPMFGNIYNSHRHECHFFLLVGRGTAHIEIDLEKYEIKTPAVIYIHPNQVHRIVEAEKADFHLLGITNENLNPKYLKLLEHIVPAKPITLKKEILSIVNHTIFLCMRISERKQNKLYPSLLRDSCNTLVAFIVSQYLEQLPLIERLSRFDVITKSFKLLLERDFILVKRPSDYATALNISTPYLNECVKNRTGFSVSYHIQQRIILEAKRLLHHSSKSVKEISAELGYDDSAYFSRLFTKVTGMTVLAFRKKNLD